ncbi:hypothetical protein AB0878_09370 [Amycolatopsis sp. NPDC047767]|uniref:hypothetical protein n=1 Tax=Amycolatopsis sp. NPDC047767 TaxID=3156765 RepID=UPI0034514A63
MSIRHRFAVRVGAGSLLLASAAACSGPGSGAGPATEVSTGVASTASSVETTGSNPSTEGTGPEPPRSSEREGSVALAGLPVGGGNDASGAQDCIRVSLLDSNVPEGARIAVGEVAAGPGDLVTGGGACGGPPACSSYTFTAQDNSCSVALSWHRPGDGATLTMKGSYACGGDPSACAEFGKTLRTNTIDLTNPLETPETTTTTEESAVTTTESTTTSATSG